MCCFGQGRVVVNEFMSWSGCNVTSEFIELMNFGPGPMDIGCYIVTNGQYAVTIPPNTVILPGKFYVLSGQDVLLQDCGNIDSAIQVDLNWETCNCTDKPVPTTGDGFLKNGGSANEKIILLDPDLNVVDAVSRQAIPSSSVSITTASLSGACASKTFDLDLMSISYESIENSTGIDNSFARKVDGDCGWVKTTDISADASNKTGSTSSASYNFTTLSASECNGSTGSISIAVSAPDAASLFPMSYTLAYDKDSNSVYNDLDEYTYGVDATASSIDIDNLAYGRYKITVGSAAGCNLQNFDFFIFNCYGVVLPYRILYFYYEGAPGGKYSFSTRIEGVQHIQKMTLEAGNGNQYAYIADIENFSSAAVHTFQVDPPLLKHEFYRLKIIDDKGIVSYSKAIKINDALPDNFLLWPNPIRDKVFIKTSSLTNTAAVIAIYNSSGTVVKQFTTRLQSGLNVLPVDCAALPAGLYLLAVDDSRSGSRKVYRFVKQ